MILQFGRGHFSRRLANLRCALMMSLTQFMQFPNDTMFRPEMGPWFVIDFLFAMMLKHVFQFKTFCFIHSILYCTCIWHFFIIWCADYSVCSINGHYSTLYTFCVALRFLYTLAVQWMLKSEQRILAITSYVVTSKTSSSFIDSELCIRPPDSVIIRELEANFGYLSWDEASFQEKVLKSHVIVVH